MANPARITRSTDAKVAALEAENARLREALSQIAEVPHDYPGDAYWLMRKTAEGAISSTKETK